MSDASSRPPGTIWPPRRRQTAAACAAIIALVLCLLPFGASRALAAEGSTSARISLDGNVPAVSSSGQPVVVSGTITNTGSNPISHPVVHLWVSSQLLDTRAAADGWMAGQLIVPVAEVATGTTGELYPGSTTSFAVTIPGDKLKFGYGLASLPLSVVVTDGKSSAASAIRGTARSTLHQQNATVQSPLQVSVVIPLTVPADPDLFGPTSATRAAAWERAVGPDSQVQRTLDAFAGMPVTFAVDPELVDPPAAADNNVPAIPPPASPSSSPSSSSSSSGSSSSSAPGSTSTSDPSSSASPDSTASGSASGGDTGSQASSSSSASSSPSSAPAPTSPDGRIASAVDSLADRLEALGADQSVWWLPYDDPDLTGLHATGKDGTALLARDLTRSLPAATRAIGDTRVVWPAGDAPASVVTAATKQLAAGHQPAVALLPDRAVDSTATGAAHRVSGASAALTYDESLSRIFSASSTSPGIQTSRLLTESLAIYQQSPGTARSLALVAPRTGGANPTQLAAQVAALQTAHWVRVQTGRQTQAALRAAPAGKLLSTPSKGAPFPGAPARAVTAAELAELDLSRSRLAALQSVMVDGAPVLRPRTRALDIIGSTRWRGAGPTLMAVAGRDAAAVAAMLDKLSIRASTINFFADSGDISVTVSNELNRPVRGLQLHLQPRKYLVQVTDAEKTVNVDAGARATARFHIKAVGGGTVPVDAMLSAPNGAPLSAADAPSQLQINVHPTSGWIMWVLGALAVLVLAIGLLRAILRGPRTISEPTPAGSRTPNEAIVDAGPVSKQPTDDESIDTDD